MLSTENKKYKECQLEKITYLCLEFIMEIGTQFVFMDLQI